MMQAEETSAYETQPCHGSHSQDSIDLASTGVHTKLLTQGSFQKGASKEYSQSLQKCTVHLQSPISKL